MPKVQIARLENAAEGFAPLGSLGKIDSLIYFDKQRDRLHLHLHLLHQGARLKVEGLACDQIGYVWRGGVTADAIPLPVSSSVIVEHGASVELIASEPGAIILLFSAAGVSTPSRAGGHVHLLPEDRVPRTNRLENEEGLGGALHSDATCATCEIWLHEMAYGLRNHQIPVHSHSEDEIIFVTAGEMRLGNRLYGPGTAVYIAAHTKYGFRSGPEGLNFINFRDSSPTYTVGDGSLKDVDESAYWRTQVGSPQYIELF